MKLLVIDKLRGHIFSVTPQDTVAVTVIRAGKTSEETVEASPTAPLLLYPHDQVVLPSVTDVAQNGAALFTELLELELGGQAEIIDSPPQPAAEGAR